MSVTYNGHAFIRGIGTGCTTAIGGYASVFLDSLPIAHRAKVDEHVGTDGNFCAIVHSQEYLELGISFRPASTTSEDDANGQIMLLPKGSKVVLSGFKPLMFQLDPAPAAKIDILNDPNGWILVGDATLTLNAGDPATVDLTIRHYLDKQELLLTPVPVTPPEGS